MAANSKIEWTDHTFNPWMGCTKVSLGCDHCYAEARMDTRLHRVQWGAGQPRVRTKTWGDPVKWNAAHEAFFAQHGRRQRVFCASLADVFDNEVPVQWRRDLFDLIEATPQLDWLLLTKRIGNARSLYGEAYLDSARPWPENVWLGATVVNQEEAARDIPKLLAVPAAKRFLSIEPLLGPVDLRSLPYGEGEMDCLKAYAWEQAIDQWRGTSDDWVEDFEDWYGVTLSDGLTGPMHNSIDWVIVGGESGPGARPMHPDWVRGLRDQCNAAGVPFFFKQWGSWREPAEGEAFSTAMGRAQKTPAFIVARTGTVHCFENEATRTGAKPMLMVGKKAAGRLLNGREWNEVPG